MSQDVASHPETRSDRRRSQREVSRLFVAPLTIAAAVCGAFAGCHPTGTHVVDPLETAAFAAGFTLLTSRAARGTWLVLGVASVLLARSWLLIPAVAVVLIAFLSVLAERSRRRLGALVGALGVQVVLRWPTTFFHGFPSLVAAGLVVLVGISAWRRTSRRTRRRALWSLSGLVVVGVVVSIPAVVAVLLVRGQANAAERSAEAALSIIGGNSSTQAAQDLRTAAADAAHGNSTLSWWLADGIRAVPLLAQQDRFLTGTLRTAAQAAAVGARETPAVDYHRLGYHHGEINLPRLSAMVRPMSILANELTVAARGLDAVGSSWLLAPLESRSRSFRRDVTRAGHAAMLAVEAAKVLPGMLGGAGTRTYLVAFMTPSEARGYDGFIGSYGVLTATNGRVRLSASGSITDIEKALPKGGAILTGPADYLARYGAFRPGMFPQDASYSPDFPTVASVLRQIYTQAGGPPIDGVLGLDPYGLAALLRFTGPVDVPGLPFPLTSSNAAQVLLKEQYTTFDTGESNQNAARHDFLQGALRSAFESLVNGSLPAPRTVSGILDPEVVDGRISFWSFRPQEQPFLRSLGISGAFPGSEGGDLLGVTTQNTGNNKIDAYLHTAVQDTITFNPVTGYTTSIVTVRLTNDAASNGLPPIVIESPADPGLPAGANRSWLTVYSPLELRSAFLDGRRTTMTSGSELGENAYSGYLAVPSKSTGTLQLDLAGRLTARSRLPMTVRLQPSANPERVHLVVSGGGASLLSGNHGVASWTLGAAEVQRRILHFEP